MSTADNALILYDNLADEASVTASSEIADAEATMVQEMEPGEPWIAGGKVEETLTFDHGTRVSASHGAVVAHNLSAKDRIQCLLSDDPSFDPANNIFDSTALRAWDPIAGFGHDGFGRNLGGFPILSKKNDYRPLKIIDFNGRKRFRYSRYVFTAPNNTSITNIMVGRIFVGTGTQFKYNFDYDWENDWTDNSEQTDTQRTIRVKRYRTYRILKLTFSNLTESEAINAVDDIKRRIGAARDIIIQPFPTAGAPKRYRTAIYGIPVDRLGVSNPYFDVFKTGFYVRELAA